MQDVATASGTCRGLRDDVLPGCMLPCLCQVFGEGLICDFTSAAEQNLV